MSDEYDDLSFDNDFESFVSSMESEEFQTECSEVESPKSINDSTSQLLLTNFTKSNENKILQEKCIRRNRNYRRYSFPANLYKMLDDNKYPHIVSWDKDGQCFMIHNSDDFEATVLPEYFEQIKSKSFRTQLRRYRFTVYHKGNRFTYWNPEFQQANVESILSMKPTPRANNHGF